MSITEAGRSVDARHFDALAKTLSVPDSRRRLLALLATLPILGGLLSLHPDDDAEAKERRRRRKQRHKNRKSLGKRKGKHKQGCTPKSKSQVCAGTCGPVKSRQTCGKTVDCGSCDCSPACEECFTCQGAAGAPGTCVPQQSGTPCGVAESCASGTLQPRGTCDGSGTCVPADPVSCTPYIKCDGDACASSCTDDADCVAGSFCAGDQCVGDRPDGEACAHDGQCTSRYCVEQVCCDTACDGDCQACNLNGSVGTCTTVPNLTPCGGDHNVCCAGTCQECCNDSQCENPEPICVSGTCTACAAASQCGDGNVCCGESCFAGICCADAECAPGGDTCDNHECTCGNGAACSGSTPDCCGDPGGCTNTATDRDHCGACDVACGEGQACQAGVCGVACGSDFCPAASEICVNGACQTCDVTCEGDATACGDALQAALAGSQATLYVCPGTYAGGFTIARDVTVIGAGDGADPARDTILDGGGTQRVLDISSGTVMLHRLRITQGDGGTGGGGIAHLGGELSLQDCTVTANNGRAGGGIAHDFGTLTMMRCTVSNNTAPTGGGAASGGGLRLSVPATLTDCQISGNTTDGAGGGIYAFDAPVILAGETVIQGNTAFQGGGIYSLVDFPGSIMIGEDCRITGNTAAAGLGGGIYRSGGSGEVTLEGTDDPSPIVTGNCHENCGGTAIARCAATPVSCPA